MFERLPTGFGRNNNGEVGENREGNSTMMMTTTTTTAHKKEQEKAGRASKKPIDESRSIDRSNQRLASPVCSCPGRPKMKTFSDIPGGLCKSTAIDCCLVCFDIFEMEGFEWRLATHLE